MLDLHISMRTRVCQESAKWNAAARRQRAGDPAERGLPQQRRPIATAELPGRALAGVKVEDVDIYPPSLQDAQPHDPAGPRQPGRPTLDLTGEVTDGMSMWVPRTVHGLEQGLRSRQVLWPTNLHFDGPGQPTTLSEDCRCNPGPTLL